MNLDFVRSPKFLDYLASFILMCKYSRTGSVRLTVARDYLRAVNASEDDLAIARKMGDSPCGVDASIFAIVLVMVNAATFLRSNSCNR